MEQRSSQSYKHRPSQKAEGEDPGGFAAGFAGGFALTGSFCPEGREGRPSFPFPGRMGLGERAESPRSLRRELDQGLHRRVVPAGIWHKHMQSSSIPGLKADTAHDGPRQNTPRTGDRGVITQTQLPPHLSPQGPEPQTLLLPSSEAVRRELGKLAMCLRPHSW